MSVTHMRFLVVLLVLVPLGAGAQTAQRLILPAPNATLAEEFSNLIWARELKDGRVILSDTREGRIALADLRTGRVAAISRRGEGPREYPRAVPVWPIGGDSSVMMDNQQRRWLLFDGPRIVATVAPDDPVLAAATGTARGTDTLGHVYSAGSIAGGSGPLGDSTALVRVSRSTARTDTLTRLKALVARQISERNKEGFFRFALPTIGTAEEAVPFADGWVAVVRLDPYRVDWRTPEGRWIKGPPLPFEAVRMNDTEQRSYVEHIAKATGDTAADPALITDWPAIVPPYQTSIRNLSFLLPAPDGRVLIPRLASANHTETRYDVVNRRGTLDGQLILPANERIVSFGLNSAYVAVTDDDGIQRSRRHAWPPIRARE